MVSALKGLLSVFATVLVPVACLLSVVHQLAMDRSFYLWGYRTFQVAAATGMSQSQLEEATDQLLSFLNGGPPVSLKITKDGRSAPLYNQKEQQHLEDVRILMSNAWMVQQLALASLLVIAAAAVAFRRLAGLRWIAKIAVAGGLLTIGTVVVMGLGATVNFQAFWTQFHLLSFSNDLWLLDPRTDYLIRMFPPPFWFQAVMLVGLRTLGAGSILLLSGLLLLWVTRHWAPASKPSR